MKKVLITGFEPFGGESINPALEAVKRLNGRKLDGVKWLCAKFLLLDMNPLKQ